MGAFRAILLAAALGFRLVDAVPHKGYGPPLPYAPENSTTARSHDVTVFAPRTEVTQSSLGLPSYWNVSRITYAPSPVIESSQSSLDTPNFTPHTERTQDSLQGPGGTISYSTAYLPTTERTQDSLDVPTGVTTHSTLPPVPIVRTERSELSLEVPTPYTTRARETPQPKAHLEQPAPDLSLPNYGSDTSEYASAQVKTTANELVPGGITVPATAHLEVSRTVLEGPTALPQNQGQQWGQPAGSAEPAQVGTYLVGATPVVAGSSATVIAGTTYSVAPSGNIVYVNGVSSAIPRVASDSGIAAVILGVLEAAVSGIGGTSIAETQYLATQQNAAAIASESLTTSASAASGSSTATPAVQTTNVAAGLVLPGLGLGAVAFIAVFL